MIELLRNMPGKGTAAVLRGTQKKTHKEFNAVLRSPVTEDMKSPLAGIFSGVEDGEKKAEKKDTTKGAK